MFNLQILQDFFYSTLNYREIKLRPLKIRPSWINKLHVTGVLLVLLFI